MRKALGKIGRGIILFGVALSGAVLLTFCASETEPRSKIVGSWIEVDGTETIEFFPDSTVAILDEGEVMNGTFTVMADSQITLKVSGSGALAAPVTAEGSFSNGVMSFIKPDGSATRYKKFK